MNDFVPSKVAEEAQRRRGVNGKKPGSVDDKPVIDLAEGDIERIVDAAEHALIVSRRKLYQRGGKIVSVGFLPITISGEREGEAQRIFEIGDHALMEALTSAANFRRFDARTDGWVIRDAPMKIVRTLQQRRERLKLPILSGIINAPTLRSDGTVLDKPGYDEATGLLYDPQATRFPAIPDKPTRTQAQRSLEVLHELIDSFPFVKPEDRAVALSAIITACIRKSLRTAPLHAFTAPVASSGKSTLVDVICAIATGREAGVISLGKTPEETEKRLGAALLSGDPVVALDNCESGLGGELLCQVLTQTVVRIRMLGQSELVEIPTNTFLTATGNNLMLVGDMARRALVCKLDPGVERPELREFANHPVEIVKRDRGKFVAAILNLLRGYAAAGRPTTKTPLGSFEEWSRTVRGALLWLDMADPVATLEEARNSDPKLDAHHAVLTQWHHVIGDEPLTAAKVIARADQTRDSAFGGGGYLYQDFRDALLAVAGQRDQITSQKLGMWIRGHKDRIVHGLVLISDGTSGGIARWRVVRQGA